MEPGNIVEYIDRQKIICAVILEMKKQRLRLLNENNREIKMSAGRLSHKARNMLDLSLGRDKLVGALKETVEYRRTLADQIDIRTMWEILNSEQEWIDLTTMTEFCFEEDITGHHEAAVIRTFFFNRLYFKFNQDAFFPYTPEQVEQLQAQAKEAERRKRLIDKAGDWLKRRLNHSGTPALELNEEAHGYIDLLKSYYLFEKESRHADLAKAIMGRAGINDPQVLFGLFVKFNVWNRNENIDLHRYETAIDFSDQVIQETDTLVRTKQERIEEGREDFTHLKLMTIDGQATLDYDDALSIQDLGDHYLLGVHIADVGHYVEPESLLDKEAIHRGSSIYMPDLKIPMLPQSLAEGSCSLKAGETRPAISTMIRIDRQGEIQDYNVHPSLIRVSDQLTYFDVNMMAEENPDIKALHHIAQKFRQKRLADGAVQITLPEVNIWIDENGELVVTRTNRESPGRLLVSEIMIMANWLMGRFLSDRGVAAVYRSQPDPRERLFKETEGTLFQNWMQRKCLSRFVLSAEPERHSGLGLDVYITATSPIRKYYDLVTQRQIRSVFGLNASCSADEIQKILFKLEQPMASVSRLQNRRKRYWLLKYLEKRIGSKEEAIVLSRRKNSYLALMTEYMIECFLPASGGMNLKPEDMIQVTIQHVDARKDLLTVFMG